MADNAAVQGEDGAGTRHASVHVVEVAVGEFVATGFGLGLHMHRVPRMQRLGHVPEALLRVEKIDDFNHARALFPCGTALRRSAVPIVTVLTSWV